MVITERAFSIEGATHCFEACLIVSCNISIEISLSVVSAIDLSVKRFVLDMV